MIQLVAIKSIVTSARDTLLWTLGRLRGRCADGPAPSGRASAFAAVNSAWKAYRLDAGARELGLHHAGSRFDHHILLTEDPRADAVLAYLARHAAGDVARVAEQLRAARSHPGRTLGRFDAEERDMLEAAAQGLNKAQVSFDGPPPVSQLMKAIARFREDYRFAAEGLGDTAERGGVWAINLALLTMQQADAVAGIVPRAALRIDEKLDEVVLVEWWAQRAAQVLDGLNMIERRWRATQTAMAPLSSDARARDLVQWLIGLDIVKAAHLVRGERLSKAGVMRALNQLRGLGVSRSGTNGLHQLNL